MKANARIWIDLQAPVAYDRHLGWELSRAAYAEDGPESWLGLGMPHQITNNAAFGGQLARLLLAALERPAGATLTVLELGGGLGGFGYHFIQAFRTLARQNDKGLELRYLLSDPVPANLLALEQNPHFQPLLASGELELVQARLEEPKALLNLAGEPVEMPACDLLLMNYLLCHLPFELWRARRGSNGFEQGLLATRWPLALAADTELSDRQIETLKRRLEAHGQLPLPSELPDILAALNPSDDLLESLAEQAETEQLVLIGSERFENLADAGDEWLKTLLGAHAGRWMMYPRQALAALAGWSESLVADGLMMISDKGWSDSERSPGRPEPSRHGRHLEWPVHFPLLKAWFTEQGFKVSHTDNPLWTLHTLLAAKAPLPPALSLSFEAELNRRNANLFAAELLDCAEASEETDPRKAAQLYTQALDYRPGEARILHALIACLFELQAFAQAAAYLAEPSLDLFGQYDFAFQRGQLALFQGDYPAAIHAFKASLAEFGPDASSYYNLGLSQMLAHSHAAARLSFVEALELDPEHELAQAALISWQETFGEQ